VPDDRFFTPILKKASSRKNAENEEPETVGNEDAENAENAGNEYAETA
jgi:hypothetical protein